MKIKSGHDSTGHYVQAGGDGTKYYYRPGFHQERARAIANAKRQARFFEVKLQREKAKKEREE